jgi:hypothetical protein
MSAATGWFVSIVAFLGLVLALHQLGVNAGAVLGTVLRGVVHILGQPLALSI